MEPNSGIKTWQWVVTVIVIVVLIVIGIIVFGNKGTPSPAATSSVTPTESVSPSALNRITMTDQYPGNVVYLSSVQVSQPSWVVIQADNNGQPGAILGSAHFDAGINPGKITLSKPMIDGGTYYAVVYSDDGSGKFNATTDQPLKDSNGNVIMHIFHASSSVGSSLKG
ncbi:MAG: hypothetical protein KGI45_03645 [Patescibacteria group bacterium]|nr:hypothetical protein [Patescibacteria group bacterium]MDE1941360.1 hypothetical protein [Patescibacteria group bacterium]MDE1967137.1 hypothetical protein [Patescibacteria group bacterium]